MNEALEWCVIVWNFAESPTTGSSVNWNTVAISLSSGLIGILGSWVALGWQARRENRSVRAAILAEIEALMEVAKRHGYSNELSSAAEDARSYSRRAVKLDIPEHYNRVFLANAPKLGVLRETEAGSVVRFYQLLDSVRASTSEGGELYGGLAAKETYQIVSDTFVAALRLGESLVRG